MEMKDFSLRIDEELLRKLHYVAEYHDRSVNRELLRLARYHVEKFEQAHGKVPDDYRHIPKNKKK